jgi:hypothetical protein
MGQRHMGLMMARQAIGGAAVLVKLGPGVAERIDVVAGRGMRSAFIRDAVDAALGGVAKPVVPKPVVVAGDPPDALRVADFVKPVAVVPSAGFVKAVNPSAAQAAYDARWAEDDAAVREYLVGKVRTERDIALALGWAPMRASRSLRAVVEAGTVVVERGSYRLVEGA